MAKKRYRKPGNLHDLQCVLWTLIRDLEDVLYTELAPDEGITLDDRLRIAHALSQMSGSYLKVMELGSLAARMSHLERLVAGNGHHP